MDIDHVVEIGFPPKLLQSVSPRYDTYRRDVPASISQDQGVLLNWYASLLAFKMYLECQYLCWYQWYQDLQHIVSWNAQLPDGVLALPPSVLPDVPGVLQEEYAWEQSTLITPDYISLAYLVCCLLNTV